MTIAKCLSILILLRAIILFEKREKSMFSWEKNKHKHATRTHKAMRSSSCGNLFSFVVHNFSAFFFFCLTNISDNLIGSPKIVVFDNNMTT